MYISNYDMPLKLFKKIKEMIGDNTWHNIVSDYSLTGKELLSAFIETLISENAVSPSDLKKTHQGFACLSLDEYMKISKTNNDIQAVKIREHYLIFYPESKVYDFNRSIAQMSPLDLIEVLSLYKATRYKDFILIRYDDIAMYNNLLLDMKSLDSWSIYDGILCECRSVVIDLEKMKIVSLPFYKFRNLNEASQYSMENTKERIDKAEHVEFTDKMDGSFVQMRYLGNDYDIEELGIKDGVLVTTSGTIPPLGNAYLQWIDSFIEQHPEQRFYDMCKDNPNITFMFEMIYPDVEQHTVLVSYDESRWGIYLIGARNIETGELAYHNQLEEYSKEYNIPTAVIYDYSLDEVMDICHSASVKDREGFVLNADGWLVKIKVDDFIFLSKLITSNSSFNAAIRSFVNHTNDDLLSKIPAGFRAPIEEYFEQFKYYDEDLGNKVALTIERLNPNDMKESASWINQNVPKPFRFYIINGLKGKGIPVTFLAKNFDMEKHQVSFLKEDQFNQNMELLKSWQI